MNALACALLVGVALVAIGAVRDTQAQAPAPPAIAGNVYTVTYVEVGPTSRAEGVGLLARYRAATRAEDGNLRAEVVTRHGQPHQFVILEVWRDPKAFDATRNRRMPRAPGSSCTASASRPSTSASTPACRSARSRRGPAATPCTS